MNTLSQYAAIIGIDWADKKHDLCLQQSNGSLEFSTLPHSPEAIDEIPLTRPKKRNN